jgi:hypothetical protein
VNDRIKRLTFAVAGTILVFAIGGAAPAAAQDDDLHAITARVHGTFEDAAGGLGVVSGDMTIARFEVLNGAVTAIGRIAGAMAVSSGNVLGRVDEDLAFAVANAGSTCNQLRMDLAATDATILRMPVHFDTEVAGFDSRDGTTPKTRPVLCAAGRVLHGQPDGNAVIRALNDVVTALAAPR